MPHAACRVLMHMLQCSVIDAPIIKFYLQCHIITVNIKCAALLGELKFSTFHTCEWMLHASYHAIESWVPNISKIRGLYINLCICERLIEDYY